MTSAARPKKMRAAELLVRAQLAPTIEAARALVMTGRVMVSIEGKERKLEKAGESLPADATFRIAGEERRFVSRGGEKLEAALEAFGIDPTDRICADIGLSTGGFTHCLLERGAARVHGVDVGYGDVAWSLRNDPRVVLWERTNARHLSEQHFGEPVSLAVIDVSFISLRSVLAPVLAQLAQEGEIVALVKPQFESRETLEGGVIRDPAVRREAVERIRAHAVELGLQVAGELESPLRGADGNVEYLLHLRRPCGSPASPSG
jgi:23S rRNA (cytidine1920-2'-O)/16S rRNA (cytidine1409-2'-O)-methyltransferase